MSDILVTCSYEECENGIIDDHANVIVPQNFIVTVELWEGNTRKGDTVIYRFCSSECLRLWSLAPRDLSEDFDVIPRP